MKFRKYQHIERFGTSEVRDIEIGECLIFPKIDGTNSSVWLNDGFIKAGSRRRELTMKEDNGGFYAHVLGDYNLKKYLDKHPTHRLFGEWLTPHSLKTYRDDTWRKFYIFDVCIDKGEEELEYLPYDIYKPLLEEFSLDYIPPIMKIKNGTYENFIHILEKNIFLIEDGKGVGEGIVIKNYNYYNQWGRQTWAKIVTNEFKEKHSKIMGSPEFNNNILEEKIIDEFCTAEFIEKEYQKILNDNENYWSSKMIPQLLGKVWHEFIVEESWNFIKKHKNPTINYKMLNFYLIAKIKIVKLELFN